MKRLLALVMVLVLALGFASVAGAQDGSGCYNLAAGDCEIINSAYANAAGITSFYQSWSIDFEASGLGILGMLAGGGVPESVTFTNTGEGPFVIDPSAEFPILMYTDQTASMSAGEEVQDFGTYAFALVNGHLYFPDGTGNNIGIPLEVLLDPEVLGLDEQLGAMGLPAGSLDFSMDDLEITTFGDILGDTSGGMGGTDAFLAPYSDYVRLADEEMMGQTMYPFVYSLDLGGLLNSEEFSGLMALAGGMGGDDPSIAAAMEVVPMLLGGLEGNIVMESWVGADDGYIHLWAIGMDMTLDLSALMGGEPGSMEPVTMDFLFEVEISQQNESFDVPVPANAMEISADEARAILGG